MWLTGGVLAGAALAGAALAPHLPVLLWNATASAPLGFYRLSSTGLPRAGDWVAYRPPEPLARWLVAGGYLPPNVPLLKQVAAGEGQTVCREGAFVRVDGRLEAVARPRDRRGAPLPQWGGCRRLAEGEVLLLNRPADSLDGRYFGVSRTADLIGRAEPLWTWGAAR
jgi:type IV secretory pathway protease TraF